MYLFVGDECREDEHTYHGGRDENDKSNQEPDELCEPAVRLMQARTTMSDAGVHENEVVPADGHSGGHPHLPADDDVEGV